MLAQPVAHGARIERVEPARAGRHQDRDGLALVEVFHRIGVRLSIDDFGTGYSSLSYLQQLPFDIIKIDRSFVSDMENDNDDATIVRSTIDLAHNLGLETVAEGVEKQEDWDLISDLHCDEGQGFFIAKPMPGDRIPSWLRHWNSCLGRG